MVYPIVEVGDPCWSARPKTSRIRYPGAAQVPGGYVRSMYAAKGVGLAAPPDRLLQEDLVIDVSNGENPADKLVLINPKIVRIEGKQ